MKQDHNSRVGKRCERTNLFALSSHSNQPTSPSFQTLSALSLSWSVCSRIYQISSGSLKNPPWISYLTPSLHSVCAFFLLKVKTEPQIFPQINKMEGKVLVLRKKLGGIWYYVIFYSCFWKKEWGISLHFSTSYLAIYPYICMYGKVFEMFTSC